MSAELLEEVGVTGFNTNLLAQRTGLGVRAIYRYFPNKWSILVALAERVGELERAWIGDLSQPPAGDLSATVDRTIDGYFAAARRHRGYVALRAASQASPELREIDGRNGRALQEELAQGLRQAGAAIDERHLRAVCLVIIETATRLLDIALQAEPQEAALVVAELKRMLVALMRLYIPG